MQTRRQFIRNTAAIAGAVATFPESIQRALAIDPVPGSSFLDAEHVVILMQENRSFDHCFGSLQGVRGFNDPRAIQLPDGNPVWIQSDHGKSFIPFRLDIRDTRATWMGSLPHTWADQQDARNGGLHDKWIHAKRSGHKDYANMPLTMGYYTRQDVPFYYAFADAFTICDQHFCSSITGTTPNRLHLWTGTIRAKQTANSPANVRNEDVDYGAWASWKTFPERLQENGISWKVYQNELSIDSGLTDDEAAWLTNFGDNPLEYFSQYHVQLSQTHRDGLEPRIRQQQAQIASLKKRLGETYIENDRRKLERRIQDAEAGLKRLQHDQTVWTKENADKLSKDQQSLHARAFTINAGDPNYRHLTELTYHDGKTERHMTAPKGDVLHQFRRDVHEGKLPAVSWLVAPERFSDHPSSPWYGAWYVSEVLDILTHNPDVWRKTVFILTYDENDGYFDHVPPFTAPNPHDPSSGKASNGIDAALEYVQLADDQKRTHASSARGGPIGLGYRVPLIIASPWSRGGCVCSQVFDHTSVIQFIETVLTHRTGKKIHEPNISAWRRTVCGDLTSAFSGPDERNSFPPFPPRDQFLEQIHKAQFKGLPNDFRAMTSDELVQINKRSSDRLPAQESGVRKARAIPYQLSCEGAIDLNQNKLSIRLEAKNDFFQDRSAGAPFIAFSLGGDKKVEVRNYAVSAGQHIDDAWPLSDAGAYFLRVHGPNGFFRELTGNRNDPLVELSVEPTADQSGNLQLTAQSDDLARSMRIIDNAYITPERTVPVTPQLPTTIVIDLQKSFGWYDFTIDFGGGMNRRYAGHVENGQSSFTDPLMGRAVKDA